MDESIPGFKNSQFHTPHGVFDLYNYFFLRKSGIFTIIFEKYLRISKKSSNFAVEFVGKVTRLLIDSVGKVTSKCVILVRKVTYDKQMFG